MGAVHSSLPRSVSVGGQALSLVGPLPPARVRTFSWLLVGSLPSLFACLQQLLAISVRVPDCFASGRAGACALQALAGVFLARRPTPLQTAWAFFTPPPLAPPVRVCSVGTLPGA
jgi:hypothetical protein